LGSRRAVGTRRGGEGEALNPGLLPVGEGKKDI